jgi:hypothetical protein
VFRLSGKYNGSEERSQKAVGQDRSGSEAEGRARLGNREPRQDEPVCTRTWEEGISIRRGGQNPESRRKDKKINRYKVQGIRHEAKEKDCGLRIADCGLRIKKHIPKAITFVGAGSAATISWIIFKNWIHAYGMTSKDQD